MYQHGLSKKLLTRNGNQIQWNIIIITNIVKIGEYIIFQNQITSNKCGSRHKPPSQMYIGTLSRYPYHILISLPRGGDTKYYPRN